jgi:hypothetical protein
LAYLLAEDTKVAAELGPSSIAGKAQFRSRGERITYKAGDRNDHICLLQLRQDGKSIAMRR